MVFDSSRLAAGRPIPRLLFVTNPDRLATHIGAQSTRQVLRLIDDSGSALCFVPSDPVNAAMIVGNSLGGDVSLEGVVIIGGHDVVPHWRHNVLKRTDYESFTARRLDSDRFWVWSDDFYGFRDGFWNRQNEDGRLVALPDVPISRIPDGHSGPLVLAALTYAGPWSATHQFGLRNASRPYAQSIYGRAFWLRRMLISPPVTADETPPYTVDGERVYLALHGYVSEPALYANPPGGGEVVALRPSNLGAAVPRVVFAAVCWSGISVKASAAETGDVEPHTVETSLALAFLSRGAAAFVGCTGVHHVNPSSTRLGAAPLHRAFWKRLRGSPPARALLEARRDYVRGMFYNDVPLERAREYKTAAEFICLGLGY